MRKTRTAAALAVAVASLTVGAGVADAVTVAKKGGTMRVNQSSDFDYSDPALAYFTNSWALEYSTCSKLVTNPEKSGAAGAEVIPDAADTMPVVSKNGRTYTFTVTPGRFKFSPPSNQPVTAKTFKFVFDRLANPKLASPAQGYITDIVGADAAIAGSAKSVSGVKVSGNKLAITLKRPLGDFLARLAMPFFCAVPTNTPVDEEVQGAIAGSGPYYIASREPKRSLELRRNPNYKGSRPAYLDKIIFNVGIDLNATFLQVKSGQVDWAGDGIPPSEYASVWAQYGPTSAAGKAGKQQFFVNTQNLTWYIALNMSRPLFGQNANLRKAVNFALDRPNYLRQGGAYAGRPTDQILPPGMIGFKDVNIFPLQGPELAKAKALAGSATGRKAVLYTANRQTETLRAQILIANFKNIGIDVVPQQFQRTVQATKAGIKGEPFDMDVEGWSADYPDPFTFFNILLDGTTIREEHNQNVSYFDDPAFNKRMHQLAGISGPARAAGYQKLDAQLSGGVVPWIPTHTGTDREFYSSRIGGQLFQNAFGQHILNRLYIRG